MGPRKYGKGLELVFRSQLERLDHPKNVLVSTVKCCHG